MKTVLLATLLCIFSVQISSAQWLPEVRLTNDPAASTGGFRVIAADGNVVHSVWNDYADGNWEIYYKRSVDGGLSWEANNRLTNDPELSTLPSLSVSGSAVHVTWGDNRDGNSEIYYKRSVDGGLSWGPDTRLTNNSAISKYSSITSSGSNVHIVWFDGRNGNTEIYYKNSIDGGDTWSADCALQVIPVYHTFLLWQHPDLLFTLHGMIQLQATGNYITSVQRITDQAGEQTHGSQIIQENQNGRL